MSDESQKSSCAMPETGTTPGGSTVPMWLFGLMFCLLFLAAWTFDLRGGWFEAKVYAPYNSLADVQRFQPPPTDEDPLFGRGKVVYSKICAPCHQDNGLGSAAQNAPPLAGSEWVLAKGPNRIVRIVLHGLSGPIEVSGKQYGAGVMTPFGSALSDEEVAAVLTFIRQNKLWQHNASAVTPEQVKAIREATKDRTANWTAPELLKESDE